MSTFDGLVSEFPDIRVDLFRGHAGRRRPPLACFLSHIHSDHLAGLESHKSPFVYCSAATREMLLRLERYPCRINYATGILEARVQRYKHLKNLLKPIPLETPATLELEPGNSIRVTLFNANHCPGAVMFLFEGQGKAVLYTGDIRGEPWFVNAVSRSPCLIEYTSGLKALDKIYLDTSFIENVPFQTKAEGIQELLHKVSRYPKDTVFHFQAWTFGYEDVWIALSKALNSKIHVDEYKMRIYKSLVAKDSASVYGTQFHMTPEAPSLVGFMCGNAQLAGCLTLDETVRLHSCEKGNYCSAVRTNPNVVWIQPIVAHLADGHDIVEAGVGGGGDDLEREAELDYLFVDEINTLFDIICKDETLSEEMKDKIQSFLANTAVHQRNVSLSLDISSLGESQTANLSTAIQAIAKKTELGRGESRSTVDTKLKAAALPKTVTFPYSRHSSYPELRHFVEAFKPKDVWPCTVSPREWLKDGITMRRLFGSYCSGTVFQHDIKMANFAKRHSIGQQEPGSQATDTSGEISVEMPEPLPQSPEIAPNHESGHRGKEPEPLLSPRAESLTVHSQQMGRRKRDFEQYDDGGDADLKAELLDDSQQSAISERALEIRANAFHAMIRNTNGDGDWMPVGLISTTDHHTALEEELGDT